MKILVTGGSGLIGHNVVAQLESLDHEVLVVDTMTNYGIIPMDEIQYLHCERQLKYKSTTVNIDIVSNDIDYNVFQRFKPDTVIHLASFPRQKVVNANPQLGSRAMSEGLLNLLESCVKHRVDKFVYVSSSMVYGDFKDQVTEDAVCKPQGQYGIMKLAGEWLIQDYTRKYGIKHVILRPSAVYGPLDVEDRVISKFILNAMRGEVLKVNGQNETLDFTYVDDAASGIVAATLSPNTNNKTYNITKSHCHTLLDAATLAVSMVGHGSIKVGEKDVDFPSRGALNIDAARRDFGFNPKIDVEEGFRRYYKWLSTSPFWIEKLNIC